MFKTLHCSATIAPTFDKSESAKCIEGDICPFQESKIDWTEDITATHYASWSTRDLMLLFLVITALDVPMHKALYKQKIPLALALHHIIAYVIFGFIWFFEYGYGYIHIAFVIEIYPAIGNLEHIGRAFVLNNFPDHYCLVRRLYRYKAFIIHVGCLLTFLVVRIPACCFMIHRAWGNPKSTLFCVLAFPVLSFHLDLKWAKYHIFKLQRLLHE
mmetsp:Transcript_36861/g.59085  ORF Transcript_36861/g.59085 Transcript_36861/m.59085 type:complete len:214 (-) Transcript_36861:172-813(-)